MSVKLQVLRFALEMFFNDDDNEEERPLLKKVCNYAEEAVSLFSDRQVHLHFRMSPTTFEKLYQKLQRFDEQRRLAGTPEVCIEKQLIVALWYLANIESFR